MALVMDENVRAKDDYARVQVENTQLTERLALLENQHNAPSGENSRGGDNGVVPANGDDLNDDAFFGRIMVDARTADALVAQSTLDLVKEIVPRN